MKDLTSVWVDCCRFCGQWISGEAILGTDMRKYCSAKCRDDHDVDIVDIEARRRKDKDEQKEKRHLRS